MTRRGACACGGLAAVCIAGLLAGLPSRAADDPTPPAAAASPGPANSTPGIESPTFGAPPPANQAASSASPPGADPTLAAEDIRDIRGPKYILPLWVILAALGAVALLALAGYGIWRWVKRRRQPRVLLPFERALQSLDAIRPLMQPASAREFSIAVSDIVRGYIEQRFDVTATHRTTEEFLRDLLDTAKPSLARHRALLAEFLQQCDLVKFGGMSLSLHSIEALHASARGFVLETAKPDPVAAPEAAHDTLPAT
jgi:hypothetical protein